MLPLEQKRASLWALCAEGSLLFVLAILLARTRKHHNKRKAGQMKEAAVEDSLMLGKVECDSSAIFEANEDCNPAEADFSHLRVELEGDWPGRGDTASTIRNQR